MESNIEGIKKFFDKIGLINFKYEEVLNDQQYNFNVFSILRNDCDEVNLHSRFLYEILNPNGSHKKGDIFLQLFLSVVGLSDFITTENSTIFEKEYRGIDILIKNKNRAIIIENKIYAKDQDKQLERYYKIIESEGFDNIKIIYLSLYGDEPSEQSIGELKEREDGLIISISYKEYIDVWLDECIKESASFPILRETLFQYRILIQKLAGKYHSKGYMMDIIKFLIDEKNIRLATDVCQALTDARIEIQHAFWQGIVTELKNLGYKIDQDDICTKQNVSDYYYKVKGNKYYGIRFEIVEESGNDIGEGSKLQFCMEIDWNIYYGFIVYKGTTYRNDIMDSKYDDLADMVSKVDSGFARNEYWLGWKYPARKYDFRSFNDENVFALANETKRKQYMKDLAIEIHEIIEKFIQLCKMKNGGQPGDPVGKLAG